MFTVEMDFDEIEITVLDDDGKQEDVKVFSYDDLVYIRQWVEKTNTYQVISLSPDMYVELMEAYQKPQGAYQTILTKNN